MAFKAGIVALLLPTLADAHAFITQPAMRGGASGNRENAFCPQCLGTTALPMPTCGTDVFLDWQAGPVQELVAGEMAEFKVQVTAHHRGHFVFRLCDRPISSSMGGFNAEEECLNEHVLERVRPELIHSDCRANDLRGDCQPFDDNNPGYWYLPPTAESGSAAGTYSFHYWIPANLTCEKCTLQFWWMSANSCTPHPDAYKQYFQKIERLGWNSESWCNGGNGACCYKEGDNCRPGGRMDCGEQFKNCADVRVVGGRGGSGISGSRGPSPSPVPTPTTRSPTTRPPTPTQRPTSTGQGQACARNPSCDNGNLWCNSPVFEDWCPLHSATNCPSPQCTLTSGGQTQQPTTTSQATERPTTAASSTAAPSTAAPSTVAPTTVAPTGGARTCVATPGMNRGVTDASCARCATGYQWWPCNEASLCQCTGNFVEISNARRLARRSAAAFLAPDHAMLQTYIHKNVDEL